MSTSLNTTPGVPNVAYPTTHSINLDFTSAGQKRNLQYLQANNYTLFAYRGATGPMQITSGVPTLLAQPFAQMFGSVNIDFISKYKVYVSTQTVISPNTTIMMQVLSPEVGLGTSLIFNSDGSFTITSDPVPADSIRIKNNRPPSTPSLTVGLAAMIDGIYAPFCAFDSTPQGSINMTPNENICLFAAQTRSRPGSVIAQTPAPGCTFSFSPSNIAYDLMVADVTYTLTNVAGTAPVMQVSPGSVLNQFLNT